MRLSVFDQAVVEKLVTRSKSPVNNGQEAAHTRPSPSNGPSVINTNNITETKNTKQKRSQDEYCEAIESYYTATFFPSKKINTIETFEILREKNSSAHPNMDSNKLATMWHTIIKKKIFLRWNRLPNVDANNNSSYLDQHHIIQPNGNTESQNTPPFQTHVNPEQIDNNVQNNNNVKISKSRKLRTKYKIKHPEEIQTVLEKIKQTIQAKAARLREYQKWSHFYKDNNLFKNNLKQFYRNIGKSQIIWGRDTFFLGKNMAW